MANPFRVQVRLNLLFRFPYQPDDFAQGLDPELAGKQRLNERDTF